jgi:hypothetical protein
MSHQPECQVWTDGAYPHCTCISLETRPADPAVVATGGIAELQADHAREKCSRCSELEAEVVRLTQERSTDWQLIETAPKKAMALGLLEAISEGSIAKDSAAPLCDSHSVDGGVETIKQRNELPTSLPQEEP